MAEFFEVPVRREDGSEALQYVNVEAVSYVERDAATDLRVYLNNGYWFTVSGPLADDVLNLIKARLCVQFKRDGGAG